MNDVHRLAGRNIWIVGASSGIGAALAVELVGRAPALRSPLARGRARLGRRRPDDGRASRCDRPLRPGRRRGGRPRRARRDRHGRLQRRLLGADERSGGTVTCSPATSRSTCWGSTTASVRCCRTMLDAGRPARERGVGGRLPGHHRRRGVRRHQGGPDQHAGGAPRRRRRTRISVTTVCPGFVRTDLTAKNAFPMPFMIAGALGVGVDHERHRERVTAVGSRCRTKPGHASSRRCCVRRDPRVAPRAC